MWPLFGSGNLGRAEFLEQLLANHSVRIWVFEKTWRRVHCSAPIYFKHKIYAHKKVYCLVSECGYDGEMTSAKDEKSESSSSDEDEESLRELVRYQHLYSNFQFLAVLQWSIVVWSLFAFVLNYFRFFSYLGFSFHKKCFVFGCWKISR